MASDENLQNRLLVLEDRINRSEDRMLQVLQEQARFSEFKASLTADMADLKVSIREVKEAISGKNILGIVVQLVAAAGGVLGWLKFFLQ